MILTLPRFWLCTALALCSATAYSQNDRVLSTQQPAGTPRSIPPIPPAAPVLNYGTVLFTPDYVAGVWVGYDMPQTIISNGYAAQLAVPIWGRFMKTATREDKAEWFRAPATIGSLPGKCT